MERTSEFLSVIVNDHLREARCAAALDRLVRQAKLARRAARGPRPSWRESVGDALIRLGGWLAGDAPRTARPVRRPAGVPC